MVRVIAAMKVFNEAWHIKKAIASVMNCVDHFIVIDGAWQHYPGGTPWSTDGTVEIIADLQRLISIEFHGGTLWDNQIVARNEYLKHGRPGDWFLYIDGDHELQGSPDFHQWIEGHPEQNTGLIAMVDDETLQMAYFPFLFKWLPELKYCKKHWILYEGEKPRLIKAERIKEASIIHCHKNKPQGKKDAMKEYSIWRRDRGWKEV